jgi:hypothetical protein
MKHLSARRSRKSGNDHAKLINHAGNRIAVEADMIAFLYPKEDWTAAEIALKVQAVAASQNIEVYSVPKFQKNRKDQIYERLSKSTQAIFLAYDVMVIDEDTREELKFLNEKRIPVYFILPKGMNGEINKSGSPNTIRTYDPANKMAIIQITERLLEDLKKDANAEGLAVFTVLVGLLLLILFLVLSASNLTFKPDPESSS